jgi:hypothetical protein
MLLTAELAAQRVNCADGALGHLVQQTRAGHLVINADHPARERQGIPSRRI